LLTRRFVQQNRIRTLCSLAQLPLLNTLNISNNDLTEISGLASCQLETLICTHNKLAKLESVQHLSDVTTLQTLDLQNNAIDDPAMLDVLRRMPSIKCVYLKGNPVVSKIPNYRCALPMAAQCHAHAATAASCTHHSTSTSAARRPDQITDLCPLLQALLRVSSKAAPRAQIYPPHACSKALIAALPELTYLDDRPVFPKERELVVAWAAGGLDGERTARDGIRDRERARDRRNFEFMQAIRAEAFRQVREPPGCAPQLLRACMRWHSPYRTAQVSGVNYVVREVGELISLHQRSTACPQRIALPLHGPHLLCSRTGPRSLASGRRL
jgi:hypothetical protein